MSAQNQKNDNLFEMSTVIKYFVLSLIFSLVILGINKIVLNAVSISPTNKVGNDVLTLYEVHNQGAAFNLFSNSPQLLILFSLAVIAIIVLLIFLKSAKLKHNAISSMALLSSGIFMNMVDRIAHGYVIDYISCNFAPSFPVFNTADIMIVCGAIGIIIALFKKN